MSAKSVEVGGIVVGKGNEPPLVCVVGLKAIKEAHLAKEANADFLEVRLDYTDSDSPESDYELLSKIRRIGVPFIATLRRSLEGGVHPIWDESGRRRRLVKIAQSRLAAAVDIEVNAPDSTLKAVVGAARLNGTPIVASHHDWEGVPTNDELRRIVRQAHMVGDIAKVCVSPRSREETVRFLQLGNELAPSCGPLVLIAMGLVGQVSRVVGHRFGSSMIFTYVGTEVPYAPGQLPINFYKKMKKEKWLPSTVSATDVRYLQYEFASA